MQIAYQIRKNNAIMINLFLDMDDTLFQTKYKNSSAHFPAVDPVLGKPQSYMTLAQQQYLQIWLDRDDCRIIPVTARDRKQYCRTHLSQHDRVELAILYFSAVILKNGQIDRDWQQQLQYSYQQLSVPIEALYHQVKQFIEQQLDKSMYKVSNVDNYYVAVKAQQGHDAGRYTSCFRQLAQTCCPDDYWQQRSGRAMAFLPHCVDKKYAVRYLQQHYPADLNIGMGDNASDWGFMQLCDFQVLPKKSALHDTLSDNLKLSVK